VVRAGTSKGSTISQYGCSTFGALATEPNRKKKKEMKKKKKKEKNNNCICHKITVYDQ
jgi:hypothetical protein